MYELSPKMRRKSLYICRKVSFSTDKRKDLNGNRIFCIKQKQRHSSYGVPPQSEGLKCLKQTQKGGEARLNMYPNISPWSERESWKEKGRKIEF